MPTSSIIDQPLTAPQSSTIPRPPRTERGRPRALIRGRMLEWARRHLIAIVSVGVTTAAYGAYSLYLHRTFQTNAFDLGIFVQAVKGYADGTGPISQIKGPGFNLLGDHFSPITALLAPVWWIFPSASTLLIAQAFLFALGGAPLIAWTRRALGAWQAITVAFIYGASFGFASAVAYDFHEVAFAVPLLSCSITALANGRFRSAAAWALPLVLVKEDLGVTVAVIGALIAVRGARPLGMLLAAAGIAATALEVYVLIPMMNVTGSYAYSGNTSGAALDALLHEAPNIVSMKVMTLLTTLLITCFIATRSTLLLIGVPTMLWRLAGSSVGYWTTGYHYSAILMPIVVGATIEVLVRHRGAAPRDRSVVRWGLITSAAVTAVLALTFPLAQVLHPTFWKASPRIPTLQAALAEVPDDVTVAASNKLVPQLAERDTVSLLGADSATALRPAYIVADIQEVWPDSSQQRQAAVDLGLANGYTRVFEKDSVVVLKRAAG